MDRNSAAYFHSPPLCGQAVWARPVAARSGRPTIQRESQDTGCSGPSPQWMPRQQHGGWLTPKGCHVCGPSP